MSTALAEYYPFSSGAGSNVTEAQWRRMMGNRVLGVGAGVMRGVQNELKVIQRAAGANMSVDVGGGECRILGHVGYTAGGASQFNVGISANASGNPRKDRIVLRADLVNKNIVLDVLTGTPAVSPAVPALTQNTSTMWEIALATVAVASGASSIVTANITDERMWANAVRWFLKWVIPGVEAVASGATNYIGPVAFDLETGWTALTDRGELAIRGGTSATVKFQQSATLAGALADTTGLTGLTASTTPTITTLATGAEVTMLDQTMVVPVITAVTSSPDNLFAGLSGWKWPTPLVT